MSSHRYRPNQQLEIYNFGVVPWLQISKELDFSNIYNAHFFRKVEKLYCFVTNEVPFRFHEELMVRFEAQKRDLQF